MPKKETMRPGVALSRRETIGFATLCLGDCRDIMPGLPASHCVVTDPPYGIDAAEWDKEIPLWALTLIWDNLVDGGSCYWFGMSPHVWRVALDGRLNFWRELVWDFGTGYPCPKNYRMQTETVLFMGKGDKPEYFNADAIREPYAWRPERPSGRPDRQNPKGKSPGNVFHYPRPAPRHTDESAHPHAKPVAMLERFVMASCPNGGVVTDPFMGSGSAAVASVRQGRHYFGIERDGKWFDEACRRVERATAQGRLF
jgi:adenine-specific DNA-methyltransferase